MDFGIPAYEYVTALLAALAAPMAGVQIVRWILPQERRLYMERAPGFADQDLVFQLLRQQSSRERLTVWWSLYPAMLVTGVFLLALVHITVFSIFRAMAEADTRWLRRVRPSVATLLTVAVSLGTIFAFAFFR